jgi:glutaconate CoA-transferase, subunit A
MRVKLVEMQTAGRIVRDGAKVVMSSDFTFAPMAMLREIARQGARNLHTIGVVGGAINLDFLVGTGQTAVLECCGLTFGQFQTEPPNFVRYLKEGRIYALDNT